MTAEEALQQADRWHLPSIDAAALNVLAGEVRRLRDLLAAAKWPEAPAERHELQAQGRHPSPCARFCEANAFEIEFRHLRNETNRMRDRVERLRGGLKSAAGKLYELGERGAGDDCMEWAGDMEPKTPNVKLRGAPPIGGASPRT